MPAVRIINQWLDESGFKVGMSCAAACQECYKTPPQTTMTSCRFGARRFASVREAGDRPPHESSLSLLKTCLV